MKINNPQEYLKIWKMADKLAKDESSGIGLGGLKVDKDYLIKRRDFHILNMIEKEEAQV